MSEHPWQWPQIVFLVAFTLRSITVLRQQLADSKDATERAAVYLFTAITILATSFVLHKGGFW